MKKTILITIGLIICSFIFFINFSSEYSINNNPSEIKEEIEKRLKADIDIKVIRVTNNKLHFVFDMNGSLGTGELRRGWTNKYKFESVGYGTNKLRERIIETNHGQYLKLAGINNDNIGKIKAYIDNEIYDIDIPMGEYFLVLEPIKETKLEFPTAKIIINREGEELYRINLPE